MIQIQARAVPTRGHVPSSLGLLGGRLGKSVHLLTWAPCIESNMTDVVNDLRLSGVRGPTSSDYG
jgi:hypothetical protein